MLPFQTNFEEAKSVNNQPEQTVNNQGFTGDDAPYESDDFRAMYQYDLKKRANTVRPYDFKGNEAIQRLDYQTGWQANLAEILL